MLQIESREGDISEALYSLKTNMMELFLDFAKSHS